MERCRYRCTFPDFEEGMVVNVSTAEAQEAAEEAAVWWERDLEDFRVLRGEATLRVLVTRLPNGPSQHWEVLGQDRRYVARFTGSS